MTISFVLRLVPDALADGSIVGELEAIETGTRTAIRDANGLISALFDVSVRAGTGATAGNHDPEGLRP
ncbi:MAG: hypothetical protein KY469_14760 [Actinobacteria bacterium]|nr:hypothetical protein [Actinomycetota bacterium]